MNLAVKNATIYHKNSITASSQVKYGNFSSKNCRKPFTPIKVPKLFNSTGSSCSISSPPPLPPLPPPPKKRKLLITDYFNNAHKGISTIKKEQPLDLSLASKSMFTDDYGSSLVSENANEGEDDGELIKVPLPSSGGKSSTKKTGVAVCSSNSNLSKRTYTEEELQAALRDIQSGKLGTRRAAVIYGIPRSTLRNKVYKLTMGRGRSRQAYLNNRTNFNSQGTKLKNEGLNYVDAFTNSQSLRIDGKGPPMHSASESLRQLLKHRMAEKEMKAKSEVGEKNILLNGISHFRTEDQNNDPVIAPLLSQVFANIHSLALASHNEKSDNHSSHQTNSSVGYKSEYPLVPLIPDLIHRLAEERIRIERERHKAKQENLNVEQKELFARNENSFKSSVILKIPSYKPSSKSTENSSSSQNSIASDTKNQSGTTSSKASDVSNPEYDCDSGDDTSTHRKSKKDSSSKMCTSADSSSSEASNDKKSNSQSPKQKRPKRGRYRNYNRDSLIEAVRAVQRGEMSVHRAGSFYGVPHSTLEYKVKERHLLRPRKRDKLIPIQPNIKKEPKAESDTTEDSKTNSNTNTTPVVTLQESSVGTQDGSTNAFPSLDFNQLATANQFFASQMMRKLQEDALMHSDDVKTTHDSGENLFGNLIKDSLDQSCLSGKPTPTTTSISIIAGQAEAK
ncbi:Mushroom body large-type Kenyon cell-specific protein 1 [Nymphon striatum]|nr:Mushroom body large-type Kenyon cell-specific protein 1 [Nymphon striatum]